MGVPGFYSWLCQRYPCIRHRLNDHAHPVINNLFIDFNSLVYNCIKFISPDIKDTNEILFNEIGRQIDLIVQTIKPTSFIYIALDGPAPFAKCAQQRSRRYMTNKFSKEGNFDTAKISVGTEFMENLSNFMRVFIKERKENDSTWKHPSVLFSDHRCPGEGEHKFFEYIRNKELHPNWENNETHVIYSPDADLIFLGLASELNYVYIMRLFDDVFCKESVTNGEVDSYWTDTSIFELIHLPILREYLTADFDKVEFKSLITDFMAISFLLGNDFIPHFPEINIFSGDFQSVLNAYKASIMDEGRLLVENGNLNRETLQIFLRAVSEYTKPRDSKKNIDVSSESKAQKYLKNKYGASGKIYDELEDNLCKGIITAFDWVLAYYLKGVPAWDWQFPYRYSPPLILVSKYTDFHSEFIEGKPPKPLTQLMSIIPPQSSYLLPKVLQPLMQPSSILSDFFPSDFKIDLNGRFKERDGIPLLPNVDIHIIDSKIAELEDKFTDKERMLNTFGTPNLFKGSESEKIEKKPPGIPSIRAAFTNEFKLSSIGVKIFQREYKGPSLSIIPKLPNLFKKAESAKGLIGSVQLVDWPFLKPAKIFGVFDSDVLIIVGKSGPIVKKAGNEFAQVKQELLEKKGIILPDESKVGVIVKCNTIGRGNVLGYSNEFSYFSADLIVSPAKTDTMRRYILPKLNTLPKIGEKIIVTSKEINGRTGTITSINDNKIKVRLDSVTKVDRSCITNYGYPYTIESLSEVTDIPEYVLEPALKSLPVATFDQTECNLAMPLYTDSGLVLDGLCMKKANGRAFAAEVIPEIERWRDRTGISDRALQSNSRVKRGELGARRREQEANISKMMGWISECSLSSRLFLIRETQLMATFAATRALEDALELGTGGGEEREVEVEVDSGDVVWRGSNRRVVGSTPNLGLRCLFLGDCGPVQFAEQGTVVGVDVSARIAFCVADRPIPLGSSLRRRLRTPRGFTAKIDDIVCFE